MALKRNDVISQWHGLITSGGYDVLITPSAEHTALPHDEFCITPYTAVWNLVDFPACVVPFLAADESLDGPDPNLPLYNPKDVHGAPGSFQVVGLRQMDEELIHAVEIISRDLEAASPAKAQL
ncbi:hypothetical protein NQ176_g4509 [Zarea fungicola]|uniref:Uncharacterized protein n=1 Tax=Zarea fungicola TaxID=93591 RepID=A0ACC1NED3_9HYPO|nr:hypothetical protein NQ176_g4509 [Lecanicillium fungicola]